MKVRIYRQRWTDDRESIHLHRDDVNQFAHEFFQHNPSSTLTMIGVPQEGMVNSGVADGIPKFGRWNK